MPFSPRAMQRDASRCSLVFTQALFATAFLASGCGRIGYGLVSESETHGKGDGAAGEAPGAGAVPDASVGAGGATPAPGSAGGFGASDGAGGTLSSTGGAMGATGGGPNGTGGSRPLDASVGGSGPADAAPDGPS